MAVKIDMKVTSEYRKYLRHKEEKQKLLDIISNQKKQIKELENEIKNLRTVWI